MAAASDTPDGGSTPHSQTLARGIRMLEILAEAEEPMSIAAVSAALGVHRSIAYRILRTLEDHGLVVRDAGGALQLGPRLAALARSVSRDLQAAALPTLTAVANELTMTAFLTVLDRHDVVTLVSVEPSHAHAVLVQRPGTRHPLASGAPGIAIQSVLSEAQWRDLGGEHPRAEAAEARVRGYATSHDEVIPGLASVAVPLTVAGQPVAAIAVVYVASEHDAVAIGARLRAAVSTIARDLD
ncbi:IclR family transcriptional regulator [Leifsonia poae]|uniref:IclR family transcriptional regulator n=1 Tax=Leifsonia poae TaxID=110933 RepID=UPI001CBF23F7|nr:helix-turn-helix domain-containing protein [Leifsonia poae]